MIEYNIFIPGSGCGYGAVVKVNDDFIVNQDSHYITNLIVDYKNKTVHPRGSSEVIGVVDRYFNVKCVGFFHPTDYNFKEEFKKGLENGQWES
jgi:hypothetical protein